MSGALQIETAEISLIGDREENQDRVAVGKADAATLLIAVDGMGGHADGAKAAELTSQIVLDAFTASEHPVFDPKGFLHLAIGRAHHELVSIGGELAVDARPRATCAVCLIQDDSAYWGHVGDSRIYHLRGQEVFERSRDHSHVEVLLQEGLIDESEIAEHPMRNFVECCLGGDASLPRMTITGQKDLADGDIVLVCTDGFWSGLDEGQIGGLPSTAGALGDNLQILGEQAVKVGGPYSDNTSAAALRWSG